MHLNPVFIDPLGFIELANLPASFISIQNGHIQIENYKINILFFEYGVFYLLDSDVSIKALVDTYWKLFQICRHCQQLELVVVSDNAG
jgi:hypothetical protein